MSASAILTWWQSMMEAMSEAVLAMSSTRNTSSPIIIVFSSQLEVHFLSLKEFN
jgi:hypothetical protein